MKQVIVAALAVVSFTVAAHAQDAGSTAKKMPDPNKRVCKTVRPTGSRMPETTCHTNAEWQAINEDKTGKAAQLMDGGDSGAH